MGDSNLGKIGEDFVASWLEGQNYSILAQRWRCSYGEVDLIALKSGVLAFVEVKTRSPRNWDADGLLAVNMQKQSRLSRAAAYFLAKHANLSRCSCRFDVALVRSGNFVREDMVKINIDRTVHYQGYQLTLVDYIESAFEPLDGC
ncbi:MAG: YraN family protein [Cyanobacteriota bacterium ELA615]|jgi:putative endonuclease